jgi:hypothetical protein
MDDIYNSSQDEFSEDGLETAAPKKKKCVTRKVSKSTIKSALGASADCSVNTDASLPAIPASSP